MKHIILAAALAFAAPAFAAGTELSVGMDVGTTESAITATLTGMGYEVRKIETDDGKIEVYVVQGKVLTEIKVDPASGKVTKVDIDD